MNTAEGYIHSIESFGTVDGPGVRFVVFFQGCPLRCLYCHNPDTWKTGGGERMTAGEILGLYRKNRPFYVNGGITATGGEPTIQMGFLTELFKLAKEEGIHTCLDTSGATFEPDHPVQMERYRELLRCTDLVMLDIKHIDEEKHRELTGRKNGNILEFARYLDRIGKAVWIRHVVVPGLTDDEESLRRLGAFIGKLSNIQAVDVLAYHAMGKAKYAELGMTYALEKTPELTHGELITSKRILLQSWRESRESVGTNGKK